MKIEIDIDLESIIVEALKKKQIADIYVPPVKVHLPDEENIGRSRPLPSPENSRSPWEYGRKNGRRRTLEEMALHELEREKGRRLTPEEKGETRAQVHLEETAENTARDAIIRKARIDALAAEGMAAASKELAEETKEKETSIITVVQDSVDVELEATIPKADKIETESLFND